MKKHTIIFLSLLSINLEAQINPDYLRDNTWVSGFNNNPLNTCLQPHLINFSNNTILSIPFSTTYDVAGSNSSICELDGSLLFYSNGFIITDKNGNLLPNGDSINPGEIYSTYPNSSFLCNQSHLFLPIPESGTKYILLHENGDYGECVGSYYTITGLYNTLIDKELNGGLGDVVYKNNLLLDDTLVTGGLTACRHGNGRDWWILVPKLKDNVYYKFLLTPLGCSLSGNQTIGLATNLCEHTNSSFSPNGEWYAILGDNGITNHTYRIHLFNFDRCDGELFSFNDLSFPANNCDAAVGIEFSDNNNFLYLITQYRIFQYNLTADDINSSKVIVANLEPFQTNCGAWYSFGDSQKMPNGNIIISTSTPYITRIQAPNLSGLSCNVQQHFQELPQSPITFPNFPNFRLGNLEGSVCDSLFTTNTEELRDKKEAVVLFPNPAKDKLNISFPAEVDINSSKILLTNATGQQMPCNIVSLRSGLLTLSVQDFPCGVYSISLSSKDDTQYFRKFVIAR